MKKSTVIYLKASIYIIITAILMVVLTRCECKPKPTKKLETETTYSSSEIEIKVIDGCEYIIYHSYKKGGICHKANCKNH